jgi:hypothetical protein
MSWKERLNKAAAALRESAESGAAHDIAARARATATVVARRAHDGAVSAADAFVEANRDPTALTIRFRHAELIVMSPSEGISITRPDAATLVVADGQGNGLVVNAAVDPACVTETRGNVARLGNGTYDLGPADGVNLVVTRF